MPRFDWSDDGYYVTEQRDIRQIRQVLIITMLLNFLAMAVKLSAGLFTGALSVVADALDSLFDGLSNVIGLAGLYAAARPPDADHPYGHRKFETVAALSIAMLLFLTAWQLIQVALSRLGRHAEPDVNIWVVAAMLISMGVQAVTSYYELLQGRRLKSELLVADALHTRASILVSFSVLGGLGLVRLGFPQADPILALFVAVFIGKIGVDVLREILPVLVDQAVIDPLQIAEIVKGIPGVESFHRVRSRGAVGSAAVDLHIRVDPHKTVQEANTIADEVRDKLLTLGKVTDVTVHMEAQSSPGADAADILALLKYTASALGLVVHESWAYRLEGELYVEVHVGVDPCLTLGEAHTLVDRLEGDLRQRVPGIKEVHTHIEMADLKIQEGDRAPEELERRVQQAVEQIIARIPGVRYPHNLIVRRDRTDHQKYYVSMECTISPDTPIADAHHASTLIEQALRSQLEEVVDVFVHLEPPDQESLSVSME